MDPLVAFAISFATLILLTRANVRVPVALAVASALFGLLSLGASGLLLAGVKSITSRETVLLFANLVSSLFLAALLSEVGLLEVVTKAFKGLGLGAAALGIPPVIGLLPMPGGAIISAMMLRDVYFKDLRLPPGMAVFVNYWFRHVFVPTWPLYQAMIIVSAVLHVPVSAIVASTWPATVAATAAGLLIYFARLGRRGTAGYARSVKRRVRVKDLAVGLSPFLAVSALVIGAGLPVYVSILIVAALIAAIYKPGVRSLAKSLRFAFNPEILLLVVAVATFKQYTVASGANVRLYGAIAGSDVPVQLVVFALPFIIGAISGGEFGFAALSIPLLTSVIGVGDSVNSGLLLIAYAAGYLGVMVSPLHLCLLLTLKYYKASLGETYHMVVAATVMSAALVMLMQPLAG